MRKGWTDEQLDYLKAHYADTPAKEVARVVEHSVACVWRKAAKLGLKKSQEFLSQCGRHLANSEGARRTQFAKGRVPGNKGKRIEEFMTKEGIENSSRTRFKKGHIPYNTREVGTEVVHADGYVFLRTEKGCVSKQRYVWEQHYGKIPKGMKVMFRDGNRQNCNIENLELVSNEELARININRETPEAREQRMRKCYETRMQIIRRDKIRIHFGLEPHTKLVKRW